MELWDRIMRYIDFEVKMRIGIAEGLDDDLMDGKAEAFDSLEHELKSALEKYGFIVERLQIDNAGPHNVSYDEHPPSSYKK